MNVNKKRAEISKKTFQRIRQTQPSDDQTDRKTLRRLIIEDEYPNISQLRKGRSVDLYLWDMVTKGAPDEAKRFIELGRYKTARRSDR